MPESFPYTQKETGLVLDMIKSKAVSKGLDSIYTKQTNKQKKLNQYNKPKPKQLIWSPWASVTNGIL